MLRVAIVDPGCRLSSLPSVEEFQGYDFMTDGFATILVEVEDSLVPVIYANRQNSYVLPVGSGEVGLPANVLKLSIDLNTQPPTLKAV